MIDEYVAVGGMRISRGTKVIGENLLWCRFVHPISYMA
jgi:hypothetical protein